MDAGTLYGETRQSTQLGAFSKGSPSYELSSQEYKLNPSTNDNAYSYRVSKVALKAISEFLSHKENNIETISIKEKVVKESEYLLTLVDNWDGQGGVAVSDSIYTKACNIYKGLTLGDGIDTKYFPVIGPGIKAGVTIEWDFENFSAIIYIDEEISKCASYTILSRDCQNSAIGKYHPNMFASIVKSYLNG